MAVTRDVFLLSFPEFYDVSCKHRDLVDAKIAEAHTLIDATAYGTNYETAVKYMAAHLIAISPCGRAARLSSDREIGKSRYSALLADLKHATSGMALRVI